MYRAVVICFWINKHTRRQSILLYRYFRHRACRTDSSSGAVFEGAWEHQHICDFLHMLQYCDTNNLSLLPSCLSKARQIERLEKYRARYASILSRPWLLPRGSSRQDVQELELRVLQNVSHCRQDWNPDDSVGYVTCWLQ